MDQLMIYVYFTLVFVTLFVVALLWSMRKKRQWKSELLKREKEKVELQSLIQDEKFLRIKAETEVESLKNQLLSEKENRNQIASHLQDSFKSMAADALQSSGKQFLDLAKATFDKDQQQAKGLFEQKQVQIEGLLKPLKESLNEYQHFLKEVDKTRATSHNSLEKEIQRMLESTNQLAQETTALKDALKRPHVRGRWGEVQLKNCVELAGMSEFADVNFQDATVQDGKTLIPDMTVKMPGGHIVVVDAKTPIEAFMKSLESKTESEKNAEMERHGRHVREHIKKLSTRAYSEALAESADFTIMFLPNESFLYAALESQPDLMEFALQKKVLIATPPTLIGLLKVIRYGWNEQKLADNAQKISEVGQELHKRVCDFTEAYQKVGSHLDKARAEYDTGWTRLNSRVLVQAKKLEKLGAKSNKSLPLEAGFDEDIEIAPIQPALNESAEEKVEKPQTKRSRKKKVSKAKTETTGVSAFLTAGD